MSFRGTKTLACVGIIALVALFVAACGSSNSKSSSGGGGAYQQRWRHRAGRDRNDDHVRHASAADRPGGTGIQRDRARLAGVLQLRQRARRRERPQHQAAHQGRLLQPDQHRQRRPPARVAEQRVRDLRGPRHPDPHQGRELSERVEGARHLRGLGLPVLGRRDQAAVHLRLAAQLHDRRKDPRPVPQAAFRRQEDRRALPGRRLRPGRAGWDQRRGSGLEHRLRAALPAGRDDAGAADHGDQGGQGQTSWSTSPCRSTPRSDSSPRSPSATSRSWSYPTSGSTRRPWAGF